MTFTNYIVLDFESFYSTKLGYTLKKMTPVEYILDERFELIGCAVIDKGRGSNFHDPYWVEGGLEFKAFLARLNERRALGEKIVMLSHNALFDMSLLAWRFGFVPDLMVDTMGMSQALLAPKVGFVSLAKISEHLGLGQKGDTVMRVDGMTLADIKAAGLYQRYSQYSLNDAVLCDGIYQRLAPLFPRQEYLVKDTVLRCAVKPHFVLNEEILHEHLAQVRADKAQLLATAGVEVDEWGKAPALMSNDKFADLLRELGVEPPMKISLTTGKPTYAFAKADQGFAELLEHEDPMVQTLAAARVGVKSTIEESRTERFINISRLDWQGRQTPCSMPVPLKYSGAHTHRLSGDWKLNCQNLTRGGRLRDSLEVPAGYVVVTCDASQIEARIAAWLAAIIRNEQSALVDAFERGDDVYSLFATDHIYHRTITKSDKPERFVGKQAILGLGFGMGWLRYMIQVRKDSRLQLKIEIILTEDESKAIVNGYRHGMAPAVPKAWRTLQQNIPLLQGGNSGFQFGPMTFGDREIIGPTGLPLFYPELEQVPGDKGLEWKFRSGRMHKRLFGGKLYENIVQHLARCCNTEAMLKVRMRTGVDLALQAHDELVYVVPGGVNSAGEPTGFAKDFRDTLLAIMHERPFWGPTLPLAAEAGVGLSYGQAK
ncbi:DNA-directed DNA polymerase I [Methylobacterium sp. GXF4]|uniref:DNA-directed DNA polymerase I n=1 Tax=Methylobacterium sp. GXF4 TaxID=1096546 RepID=UPI0002698C4D|nr:DNA-directed DNA polymerase I [Methylobacterium sp. GXF4]EIZ87127.1 DNA-directed DNA polymerase I [Methylobacterium sp. GXF4]